MAKASFDRTQINGAVWHPADKVLDVSTPYALSQAAGYLKYANGIDGGVYFRGQCAVHATMIPSLYRGLKRVLTTRETHLQQFLVPAVQKHAFLPNTPDYAREPLLQHYGIRTRWLDLVDNVWTALWFGCNKAVSTGHFDEYLHFIPSDSQHVYIVLFQVGFETPDIARPGWWETPDCFVIDLRRAAPSVYLRPHAQHGLLVRRRAYQNISHVDLTDHVVGTIRVKTELAVRWLGFGELSKTSHMFPSPIYDPGYLEFLRNAPPGNLHIGAIQHIGA